MENWEETFADNYMYLASKDLDAQANGHTWKRDTFVYPDGYVGVDHFATTSGEYHNGPECETCGYGFCEHCTHEIPKCSMPAGPDLAEKLAEVATLKRGLR